MRLMGTVALVTDSAMGIGETTRMLMAREAAEVALADIDDARGEAAASGIIREGGQTAFWHMKVSDEVQVRQGAPDVQPYQGRLDEANDVGWACVLLVSAERKFVSGRTNGRNFSNTKVRKP